MRWRYQRYKGGDISCLFCGARYSRFVPDQPSKRDKPALTKHRVIAGYGAQVFCPNCFSTARERLVAYYLRSMQPKADAVILHLSPEQKIFSELQKMGRVITADLFPGFYKSVDEKVQHQDLNALEYADASFDLVAGNHILEHIPDDRRAMREIFRVLKPGGIAILQVPYSNTLDSTIESPSINDPKQQSALFGQRDHVRIYALEDYVERLISAGFDVTVRSDHFEKAGGYGFQQDEVFFEIRKP